MLRLHSFFLLTLGLGLCSCLSTMPPEKETHVPTIAPVTKDSLDQDKDPYFIETSYIHSPFGPKSITRNIMQDSNGTHWFATWEGVISYDGKKFSNLTNSHGLSRHHVFSLLNQGNGVLWFGTIGAGIYRYDGTSFKHYTSADGLASDRQGCFLEARDGRIWIGTDDGISVFDGTSFQNYGPAEGLDDTNVNSIIQVDEDTFWIATRGKSYIFDGTDFNPIHRPDGRPFTNVRCILQDSRMWIWLAGENGLWRFDGEAFVQESSDFTGYVFEDSKNRIWTSSEDGNESGTALLSRLDIKPAPLPQIVSQVMLSKKDMFFGINEDSEENIWLGTIHGTCRYDGSAFEWFRETE